MRTILKLTILSLLSISSGLGCAKVIKSPDAPMLIEGGFGYADVSVYDPCCDCLVHYGRVAMDDLEGLTVGKYDWQEAH